MNPRINIFILSIITTLAVLFSFKGCNKPVYVIPDLSHLKAEIADLKKAASDSAKVIRGKDSIRDRVVVKWKKVRYDSLIPCEELLLYCDTLYEVDSTLIAKQKWFIGIQSDIILKQDTIIKSDSITIKELSKKPKGRVKAFITGFALGFGTGAAISR